MDVSKSDTSRLVSLADEEAVKQVLVSTLFSLWEVVNNLVLVNARLVSVPAQPTLRVWLWTLVSGLNQARIEWHEGEGYDILQLTNTTLGREGERT